MTMDNDRLFCVLGRVALCRIAIAVLLTPGMLDAQAIAGRVRDATGGPLVAASVTVEGTTLGAVAREDGTYRITGVQPGSHTVVARRVGYSPERRTVTVTSGDVTVDFQLTAAPMSLEGIVTTATGQQRRVELGNTVAAIDVAARTATAPIKSVGDLLTAQATGVQVLSSNTTGGAPRVRVRGISSASLSNDPIYIIDGIRMNTSVGGAGSGGLGVPSRLNDLNPEEVESIEVVKGPSAATLYGTDAANGVVVITTKRGRPGSTQWTAYAERGRVEDKFPYVNQYGILGKSPGATAQRRCYTTDVAARTCIVDSLVSLNIIDNEDLTPFKPGARIVAGAQVSGGSNAVRYFLSGDIRTEEAPYGLPDFERRRYQATNALIRENMDRPGHDDSRSLRANLNAALAPTFDVAVSTGLVLHKTRFMQNDNNANGLIFNLIGGPGYFVGPQYGGTSSVSGEPLMGYATNAPGVIFERLSEQSVNRFVGSTHANWRPLTWLAGTADVGLDLTDRRDVALQRFGEGAGTAAGRLGSASDGRVRQANFTTNLRGTATWQARSWAQLRSTVGGQFVATNTSSATASGSQLPPGGEAPGQGAVFSANSGNSPSRTLGYYIEEQIGFRDRLFLTAGVRTDKNSAFGVNYENAYYPKASVSWILSDESFFPAIPLLNQLRLRASTGSSGVQPGGTSALKTYSAGSVYYQGVLANSLAPANPGNPNLKPERSTEFETGFDARGFSDRVGLEFTYYRKQTRDALITQPVAPSAGISGFQANLGGIRNTGVEYRLTAQILDGSNLGWDINFGGSNNQNLVTSRGGISAAANAEIQVGRPIYARFIRPITFNDANNDGLLAPNEIVSAPASADSAVYLGPRVPPVQLTLGSNLELFRRRLRFSALLDHKSGGVEQDLGRMVPCLVSLNCPELMQLGVPLDKQARAFAIRGQGNGSGYLQKIKYTKLREVSATYDVGASLANRVRARTARLTVAARNVKMWKGNYDSDPEALISNNGDAPGETQNVFTSAQPFYMMFRINLTF
jgi:TonB-linked SusC/RagA family outer membrane protein